MPMRIEWGTRHDGSIWLSIGTPEGYHRQSDWGFGQDLLLVFIAALEAKWSDKKETA